MSRKLTPEEQKAVKNLQVSNSIYRKEIKDLDTEVREMMGKKAALEAKLPNLLGEEHLKVDQEITQLDGLIKDKIGKMAYKESRISAKEQEIADIKTKAMKEEETVLETHDPNSPEAIEARNKKIAEREAAKAASKSARSRNKKPEGPVTDEM